MRDSRPQPLLPLLLVLALGACGGGDGDRNTAAGGSGDGAEVGAKQLVLAEHVELQQARRATKRLGMQLKQELGRAMQEGGPEAAIRVCNTKATELTGAAGAESPMVLARVSTRWRNPDNAPDALEAAVLAAFEADPAHADTLIGLPDGGLLYMQPIRVQSPLCLRCHGELDELAEGVAEQLAVLYPEDHATGFAQGDLRGAFTVRFPPPGD